MATYKNSFFALEGENHCSSQTHFLSPRAQRDPVSLKLYPLSYYFYLVYVDVTFASIS